MELSYNGNDHKLIMQNITDVSNYDKIYQPQRALFAIGGMSSDLSVTLDRETSELELIEKDLASTHYATNQQKILRPFHSTSKRGSGAFNETISSQSTASPTSVNIMDNSDNIKKQIHNKVFVELYDLDLQKGGEWTETARWIKYEEDVEGTDHHWGQPHVSFLSFHALLSLRKFMRTGMILLDCKAKTFLDICDQVANAMISEGITCRRRDIMQILAMKQAHPLPRRMTALSLAGSVFDRRPECNLTGSNTMDNARLRIDLLKREHSFQAYNIRKQPTIAEVDEMEHAALTEIQEIPISVLKQQSFPNLPAIPAAQERLCLNPTKQSTTAHFISDSLGKVRTHSSEIHKGEDILKKLPVGIETAQIFVGVIPNLTKTYFVMLRLSEATVMPEILDGEVPLRFAVVILGPGQPDVSYHEVGRSIATLMTNTEFNAIAYEANVREELICGVDNFLDDSVVIPPGEIDNKRLLSGDEIRKALKKRQNRRKVTEEESSSPPKNEQKNDINFKRHFEKKEKCRFFSGMINDFEKRFPYYWSDYRDALNFQCLTSVVFMFCASFAPAITFGGLLGKYTNEKIGILETLMAQCICGVLWGIFAVQPLMIMSATGPVLVFEVSLYAFCTNLNIDFLTVRLYAGLWVLVISIITVAVDGSRMLRYVTRFTEDIFASLISVIFIAESLRFLYQTFIHNPVANFEFYRHIRQKCEINAFNEKRNDSQMMSICNGEPNTALLTTFIMISTFALAYGLRQLRQSYYLGRTLRRALGDFGVLIAIAVVASVAHLLVPDPYLQRLEVPDHFSFTNIEARQHGLFVSAYLPLNQLWVIIVAIVAALLVFILLFVETEITELLLSRKDRCLMKGSGLHWDLLLMGACTLLCSIFGLPWMCAAAVQSLAHCSSLSVPKKTAPGERPGVDYVLEQRVTTIGVSLLMGLFAFGGSYLRLPLASLFGVFLYLGVMNLTGVQFIQRIILFFIPGKYFPDTPYTESVDIRRMHLYTAIQIICLIIIYAVKYFKRTALAFPFILMLFILLRQFCLKKIFTEKELKALDGDDETNNENGWLEKDFFEDAPLPV
uniref:Anion exchange protein n=2 Tax=Wuchereria bancrofti TaxID=6293 RepID=A0AAF5PG30_WUCBA